MSQHEVGLHVTLPQARPYSSHSALSLCRRDCYDGSERVAYVYLRLDSHEQCLGRQYPTNLNH